LLLAQDGHRVVERVVENSSLRQGKQWLRLWVNRSFPEPGGGPRPRVLFPSIGAGFVSRALQVCLGWLAAAMSANTIGTNLSPPRCFATAGLSRVRVAPEYRNGTHSEKGLFMVARNGCPLRALPVVAGALLLLFSQSSASAEKLLRVKFTEGDTRDLRIVQTMTLGVSAGGKNSEVKLEQSMVLRQVVETVDDQGTATVTQQFSQIKLEMNGAADASFAYDSQSAEEPKGVGLLMVPIIQAMTKGKVTTRISSRGQILEVTLPQEMLDAATQARTLPGIAQMLSKESLTQMLQQSIATFPENPVDEGAKWSNSMKYSDAQLGDSTIEMNYTYEGEKVLNERRVDRVAVGLQLSFAADEDSPKPKIEISNQEGEGHLNFDARTGHLVSGIINHELRMELSVPSDDDPNQSEIKVLQIRNKTTFSTP
jgi:hypothetical protein